MGARELRTSRGLDISRVLKTHSRQVSHYYSFPQKISVVFSKLVHFLQDVVHSLFDEAFIVSLSFLYGKETDYRNREYGS